MYSVVSRNGSCLHVLDTTSPSEAYMDKQVVELGGKIFHKENFQEIFRGVENFSFPLFSEF